MGVKGQCASPGLPQGRPSPPLTPAVAGSVATRTALADETTRGKRADRPGAGFSLRIGGGHLQCVAQRATPRLPDGFQEGYEASGR
jgi:hypothetical protein